MRDNLTMAQLLTNKIGGYYTDSVESSYDGTFFYIDEKTIKIIDEIRLMNPTGKKVFMPFNQNCLSIKFDNVALLTLFLDIRDSYDFRSWGKFYDIETIDDKTLIIHYTKKTDNREDGSHDVTEYEIFVAMKISWKFQITDTFDEKHYPYDERRGNNPLRHVYNSMNISTESIHMAVAKDRKTALSDLNNFIKNESKLQAKQNKEEISWLKKLQLPGRTLSAYIDSVNAINHLLTDNYNQRGIYAGLPWFFQFWARDELISIGSLICQKNYEDAKTIINKYLNNITDRGRIPNRVPGSTLGSADGIGWLFKRIADLVELNQYSADELSQIKKKLNQSIERLYTNFVQDTLIHNDAKETWMDTTDESNSDTRQGACIEIQAQLLNIYKLQKIVFEKTGEHCNNEYDILKEKIRKEFWTGKKLKDTSTDQISRPNIFLAYYICPDFLTNEEWEIAFEHALKKLWLPWGGLSTIDKSHDWYQPYHTGQNNKSYHRGDSWYWVNNLAALCLYRVNKEKFNKQITQITLASIKDIKEMGYKGYHSEISSAEKQEPFGCWAQAWSSAMFIELCHQLIS